jgi:pyocin large subunit-like protein
MHDLDNARPSTGTRRAALRAESAEIEAPSTSGHVPLDLPLDLSKLSAGRGSSAEENGIDRATLSNMISSEETFSASPWPDIGLSFSPLWSATATTWDLEPSHDVAVESAVSTVTPEKNLTESEAQGRHSQSKFQRKVLDKLDEIIQLLKHKQ